MNMILHILLGLISGSFFYGIVTGFKKNILCKNGVISVLLTVFSFAMVSLATPSNTLWQNVILYMVLITLCYESISDIEIMHTYTLVIAIATIFVLAIRIYQWGTEDTALLIWQLVVVLLVKLACVSLEIVASNVIGGGDLDMYFLLYLASGVYGVFLLLCTTIVFLKHSMAIKKVERVDKEDVSANISQFMNKRIAFVPFLLFGFVFMTLL